MVLGYYYAILHIPRHLWHHLSHNQHRLTVRHSCLGFATPPDERHRVHTVSCRGCRLGRQLQKDDIFLQ